MQNFIDKTISDSNIRIITKYLAFGMLMLSIVLIVLATFEALIGIINFSCPYATFFDKLHCFFSYYTEYGWVFGGTFVVFASKYALDRVIIASDSNALSEKQAFRAPWYEYLKNEVLNNMKENNEVMYSYIVQHINSIFDFVYENGRNIESKEQLEYFFKEFIGAAVFSFENGSIKYKANNGIYPDKEYSYARDEFFEILYAIAPPSKSYEDKILMDYINLYNYYLNEFMGDREISQDKS